MSRISLIQKLYSKNKSALEFDYDELKCPSIYSIMTPTDVGDLHEIATSVRYNAKIDKKYKFIDSIMQRRGFRFAHRGTNRVVYNFLDLPTFVSKIAVDRVGLQDNPAEFKNQELIKPFCTKIFEVSQDGVLGFVERVNPITSLEEFLSISDDVFNMMVTKIIGKCVIDDAGMEYYMNYGVRHINGYAFGPVILDFPYVYKLDANKLICMKEIKTPIGPMKCGGDIDYDSKLSHLVCTKCGRTYTAQEMSKPDFKLIYFEGTKEDIMNGVEIVSVKDRNNNKNKKKKSGMRRTNTIISPECYDSKPLDVEPGEEIAIKHTVFKRSKSPRDHYKQIYSDLQRKYYEDQNKEEEKHDYIKIAGTRSARNKIVNANTQQATIVTPGRENVVKPTVVNNASSAGACIITPSKPKVEAKPEPEVEKTEAAAPSENTEISTVAEAKTETVADVKDILADMKSEVPSEPITDESVDALKKALGIVDKYKHENKPNKGSDDTTDSHIEDNSDVAVEEDRVEELEVNNGNDDAEITTGSVESDWNNTIINSNSSDDKESSIGSSEDSGGSNREPEGLKDYKLRDYQEPSEITDNIEQEIIPEMGMKEEESTSGTFYDYLVSMIYDMAYNKINEDVSYADDEDEEIQIDNEPMVTYNLPDGYKDADHLPDGKCPEGIIMEED